jgi:heme/copper-type cytochrome/quinol oxidase subunit 2
MIIFFIEHPIIGVLSYLILAVLGVVININAKKSASKLLYGLYITCCVFVGTVGMWIFYLLGNTDHTYRTNMGGSGADSQVWWVVAGVIYAAIAFLIRESIEKKHKDK